MSASGKGEAHVWVGTLQIPLVKEIGTGVWGAAHYLAPVVDSVFPERDDVLKDEGVDIERCSVGYGGALV